MPYEHRLPTVLNPTGDIVVPLFIPHDPQYTGLLLGVLRQLEETERYQRDPNYDDENAQIVTEQWRERTITPLIEAIASGQSMILHIISEIVLSGNQTRSNTAFAAVSGSTLSFTASKKNIKITVSNIRMAVTAGAGQGFVRVALGLGSVQQRIAAVVINATARDLRTSAIFENVPAGSVSLSLEFATSAGSSTITVFQTGSMLVEIEEWD